MSLLHCAFAIVTPTTTSATVSALGLRLQHFQLPAAVLYRHARRSNRILAPFAATFAFAIGSDIGNSFQGKLSTGRCVNPGIISEHVAKTNDTLQLGRLDGIFDLGAASFPPFFGNIRFAFGPSVALAIVVAPVMMTSVGIVGFLVTQLLILGI